MAGTKRFDGFEALVRHEALEIAGPNPALHCAKQSIEYTIVIVMLQH